MKKIKKILALLLALAMVGAMLVGCNSSTSNNGGENNGANSNGGNSNNGDSDEIPTLTWYMVGNGQPANIDSWSETVNAYLEEKIGVHLNLQCVSWGDWGNRRTVIVQTNEPWDLIFTDMSAFNSGLELGAYADLTELIKETPGLTDVIPEAYLQGAEVDGHLYAIPAYKDTSMTNFFVWTKDIVEANFPEYTEAHSLADILDGLRACKENSSEIGLLLNSDGVSCVVGNRYDNMGIGLTALGVSYFSGTAEVVCTFEQEDVMEQLKVLNTMMNEGLINSDAAVLGEATGMCIVGVAQGWPSAASGWGDSRGTEVVVSQFGETVVSNDTIQGSMTCISSSSSHQLEALKLLELVNTDTKLRDWLAYGEEGVNFEYVDVDGVQKINKLNNDWTLAAYTQGTYFNMSVTSDVEGNPYLEEVQVQNENAIASPALGFHCDTSPVADQIAACSAIFEGYKGLLFTGTGDPEATVAQMMSEMRASGFDDIVAEVQAQLDAYLAS